MRISDWSSDVCSSDLRAFGIEQIERIDRALALLRARDRGGARGLIMRGLERRAAIEIVAVRRQRSLGFAQRRQHGAVEARERGLRLGLGPRDLDRTSPRLNSSH